MENGTGGTMTPIVVGAVALGFSDVGLRLVAAAVVSALVVTRMPVLVAPALLVAALVAAVRRFRRARQRAATDEADLAALCDLTAIALTGGLGLQASLEMAAEHVGGSIQTEVCAVLRQARVDGLAAVMGSAGGAGRRLYRIVGQGAAAGSSLLDPVARLADDLHSELAATRLEVVRRLPISMLFPLTTLILPGFLLLSIAPAVLDAFTRLEL